MIGDHGNVSERFAVHVESMPKPHKAVRRTVPVNVVIQAAATTEPLLAASDTREVAYILPIDDNVVIGQNQSDVAKGYGSIIPKTLTAPWPIYGDAAWYVAAPTMAGATSRVTVMDVHCTYE